MAFHLHRNGTSTVFEIAELREMARRGDLPQDEYVYVDEKGEWLAANAVPELGGAWNIEETEATVAVQLTPELLASMSGLDAFTPAVAPAAVAKIETKPEPEPEPMPVAAAPTASGLIRASDKPGALAAQSISTDEDNVATTFMQVPEELRQAAPRPATPAKASVKVSLPHARVDDDEPATAYMEAIPANLPLKTPAPAAAPAPAAQAPAASKMPLYIGGAVAALAVIGGLLWWLSAH